MGKNQDPGSGINIPDPQHWNFYIFFQVILKDTPVPERQLGEAGCSCWKQLLFFTPTVPPKPNCCSSGLWPCPKEHMSEAGCSCWKQLLFSTPTVPPKPSCCSKGQWPCPKEHKSEAGCSCWKQLLFFTTQLFLQCQAAVLKDSDLVLRDIWMKPVVPAENSCCSLHQLFLKPSCCSKGQWPCPKGHMSEAGCSCWKQLLFFTSTVPPKLSCCSKGQWPCPKWQLGEAVYFWWQYLLFLLRQAAVLKDAPVTYRRLRKTGCSFGKQLMFVLFLLGQAAVPKKHPT